MLHVVHRIERRTGRRFSRPVPLLVLASALLLAAGIALALI